MVKRGLVFLLVAGFMLSAAHMLRSPMTVSQPAKHKALTYTIKSDHASPVEIRQVIVLPVSAVGSVHFLKNTSDIASYVSNRVTLKYLNSRYPLYIKERIWSPVFLRNNSLRI